MKLSQGDETDRVRRALLERFGDSVRRQRHFEVELFNPTALDETWKADIFSEFHRRTLRPWLERVASCKVLYEPPNPRTPHEFLDRTAAKLERVGARPSEWLARYVKPRGEAKHLPLTPEVLSDELF